MPPLTIRGLEIVLLEELEHNLPKSYRQPHHIHEQMCNSQIWIRCCSRGEHTILKILQITIFSLLFKDIQISVLEHLSVFHVRDIISFQGTIITFTRCFGIWFSVLCFYVFTCVLRILCSRMAVSHSFLYIFTCSLNFFEQCTEMYSKYKNCLRF